MSFAAETKTDTANSGLDMRYSAVAQEYHKMGQNVIFSLAYPTTDNEFTVSS